MYFEPYSDFKKMLDKQLNKIKDGEKNNEI